MVGAGLYVTHGPGDAHAGPLPALSATQKASAARLRAHVHALAVEIGARDVAEHPKALARAADYVEAQLKALGYEVKRQPFAVGKRSVHNLEAALPGEGPELVVVGAHYDTVPTTPGADDNASGTAAMIEIARALKGKKLKRSLRFVAFVNEEPPYFKTDLMGSVVYAKGLKAAGAKVKGMLSLETLGYYDTRPDTQSYPPGLSAFYPSTGDFVAIVGTGESRALVHRLVSSFRASARFPSESIAAPGFVQGVDYSDHWSFAREGYPAVMVTDTAFMRNAHYHEPSDRAETLDYGRLARVTEGLAAAIEELAGPPR